MDSREGKEQAIQEALVSDILKNVEQFLPGIFILRYGDKELEICVFEGDDKKFTTALEKMNRTEKKESETRLLYTAAKKFMQEQTNMIGSNMSYSLDTANPNMIAFARTHGNSIFGWDNQLDKEFSDKHGNLFYCSEFKKTFVPEKKT